MDRKGLIRKRYLKKRKRKYFQISENFFTPLINLIKKNKVKKNISIYYPSSHEVDVLKIFNVKFFQNFNFLLPIIEDNGSMNFYLWKKNSSLRLNKYGIPEPIKFNKKIPDIILVPLLAYDK